jgi:hypothetical protein
MKKISHLLSLKHTDKLISHEHHILHNTIYQPKRKVRLHDYTTLT